jgi:Fur family ferric uptake transcriptional regulator
VLEDVGLVRHVHLGHGPGLYHPAGLDREFVVCERCGAVRAVAPAELDDVRTAVLEAVGYRARFTHFPLAGLCPACAPEGDA